MHKNDLMLDDAKKKENVEKKKNRGRIEIEIKYVRTIYHILVPIGYTDIPHTLTILHARSGACSIRA